MKMNRRFTYYINSTYNCALRYLSRIVRQIDPKYTLSGTVIRRAAVRRGLCALPRLGYAAVAERTFSLHPMLLLTGPRMPLLDTANRLDLTPPAHNSRAVATEPSR